MDARFCLSRGVVITFCRAKGYIEYRWSKRQILDRYWGGHFIHIFYLKFYQNILQSHVPLLTIFRANWWYIWSIKVDRVPVSVSEWLLGSFVLILYLSNSTYNHKYWDCNAHYLNYLKRPSSLKTSELQACQVDTSMGQCEARVYSTCASTCTIYTC